MKMLKFKMWLASISKATWIYVIVIAALIAVAIACLAVWMHICGYTLASWLGKYWPILTLAAVTVVAVALFLIFLGMRKRR